MQIEILDYGYLGIGPMQARILGMCLPEARNFLDRYIFWRTNNCAEGLGRTPNEYTRILILENITPKRHCFIRQGEGGCRVICRLPKMLPKDWKNAKKVVLLCLQHNFKI